MRRFTEVLFAFRSINSPAAAPAAANIKNIVGCRFAISTLLDIGRTGFSAQVLGPVNF